MSVKKEWWGSGHAMNHLQVPNLDDPTSSHSFKLYMTAQSSSTNEKIYLSKVLINFAKKLRMHNITTSFLHTLEHPSTTSKASSSTNIKDLNLMVITFLENIMKKYKFNKFKK